VQTRAGRERAVSLCLESKGYEQFLPMTKLRKHPRQELREAETPLFPGYLFCRPRVECVAALIVTTPGVCRIVSFGKNFGLVSAVEVEAIRSMVSSGLRPEVWHELPKGQSVVVKSGPLRGDYGIFLNLRGRDHIVVLVPLLGRAVAVEIHASDVSLTTTLEGDARTMATAMRGGACDSTPQDR
jgi:transcriptional antiterminator RfaH